MSNDRPVVQVFFYNPVNFVHFNNLIVWNMTSINTWPAFHLRISNEYHSKNFTFQDVPLVVNHYIGIESTKLVTIKNMNFYNSSLSNHFILNSFLFLHLLPTSSILMDDVKI